MAPVPHICSWLTRDSFSVRTFPNFPHPARQHSVQVRVPAQSAVLVKRLRAALECLVLARKVPPMFRPGPAESYKPALRSLTEARVILWCYNMCNVLCRDLVVSLQQMKGSCRWIKVLCITCWLMTFAGCGPKDVAGGGPCSDNCGCNCSDLHPRRDNGEDAAVLTAAACLYAAPLRTSASSARSAQPACFRGAQLPSSAWQIHGTASQNASELRHAYPAWKMPAG